MQKSKSITEKFQTITANAVLNHGTTIVLTLMGLCLVVGYILSISWHTVSGAILCAIPTPLLFVLDKVDEIKAYVAEKSGVEWEAK